MSDYDLCERHGRMMCLECMPRITIPPNTLKRGDVIRVTARGTIKSDLTVREGDQPLPVGNDQPVCHTVAAARFGNHFGALYSGPVGELVQQDLLKRLEVGMKRYGQPLQPFNGRSFVRDQYEEVLDAIAYGQGVLLENRFSFMEMTVLRDHYFALERLALSLRELLGRGK